MLLRILLEPLVNFLVGDVELRILDLVSVLFRQVACETLVDDFDRIVIRIDVLRADVRDPRVLLDHDAFVALDSKLTVSFVLLSIGSAKIRLQAILCAHCLALALVLVRFELLEAIELLLDLGSIIGTETLAKCCRSSATKTRVERRLAQLQKLRVIRDLIVSGDLNTLGRTASALVGSLGVFGFPVALVGSLGIRLGLYFRRILRSLFGSDGRSFRLSALATTCTTLVDRLFFSSSHVRASDFGSLPPSWNHGKRACACSKNAFKSVALDTPNLMRALVTASPELNRTWLLAKLRFD